MAKKTNCPITRGQFRAHARPVSVTIGDRTYTAAVKEFSTGSLGWNVNDKATIEIDGVPVAVQIGLNLTIVGSKDLPQEAGAAAVASGEVA
jgi:hypothetical protein